MGAAREDKAPSCGSTGGHRLEMQWRCTDLNGSEMAWLGLATTARTLVSRAALAQGRVSRG